MKLKGIPRSPEVLEKILRNKTDRKKVISNGIIYESITDAAKQLKIGSSIISNICNNKHKSKKYNFSFYTDKQS